jgi:hypothetical protein
MSRSVSGRLLWLIGAAPLIAMAQGEYALAPAPAWLLQDAPIIADQPVAAEGLQ